MGAHNEIRIVPKSQIRSIKKLRQWWDSAVDHDQWENGHSAYSGGIGTFGHGFNLSHLKDKPFSSRCIAEDYILDHHEKWQSALVVTFKEKGKQYWMIGGWAAS